MPNWTPQLRTSIINFNYLCVKEKNKHKTTKETVVAVVTILSSCLCEGGNRCLICATTKI